MYRRAEKLRIVPSFKKLPKLKILRSSNGSKANERTFENQALLEYKITGYSINYQGYIALKFRGVNYQGCIALRIRGVFCKLY